MRFLMQRGDTVKLTAVFRDWGGDLVNPDNVGLKIYNAVNWTKCLFQMDESLGNYFHFYTRNDDSISMNSGTLDGNTVYAGRILR